MWDRKTSQSALVLTLFRNMKPFLRDLFENDYTKVSMEKLIEIAGLKETKEDVTLTQLMKGLKSKGYTVDSFDITEIQRIEEIVKSQPTSPTPTR